MEFLNLTDIADPFFEDSCYKFLEKFYKQQLFDILEITTTKSAYSIEVDYVELHEEYPLLGNLLLKTPDAVLEEFDKAAKRVVIERYNALRAIANAHILSKNLLKLKLNIHIRFKSLPVCQQLYRLNFPNSNEHGSFLSMVGTIVRVSAAKVLEYSRPYICNKCDKISYIKSIPSRYHTFPKLVECQRKCVNAKSIPVSTSKIESCTRDYQEMKLQEQIHQFAIGTASKTITIVLEDDLIQSCKPGDDVTITGVLFLRWKTFKVGQPMEAELVCRANNIHVNKKPVTFISTDEVSKFIESFWLENRGNPFAGINNIIASFCPEIYGMYFVKYAMCMVLAGGNSKEVDGTRTRGHCHMLLIGDPGVGKSQLLKYTSKISPRCVMTTGVGTSSAGLTVSAVKDNDEWHLEAGALVLADGGVCCIDEFSCIKKNDLTSIHEAMEQQSISVAKAGMVVKIQTEFTMLAATNPKENFVENRNLSEYVGIDSPLLSRFDVIMVLRDINEESWESILCDNILKGRNHTFEVLNEASLMLWNAEQLEAYLSAIKKVNPEMTLEANEIITTYYQYRRNETDRDLSRTTIRLLESLRRLSEGHARLMNRDKVLVHDAIIAVSIMEFCTASILTDGINLLQTTAPLDCLTEYETRAKKILTKLNLHDLLAKEKEYIQSLKCK